MNIHRTAMLLRPACCYAPSPLFSGELHNYTRYLIEEASIKFAKAVKGFSIEKNVSKNVAGSVMNGKGTVTVHHAGK